MSSTSGFAASSDAFGGPWVQPPRALVVEPSNVLHEATIWRRWVWQLLSRMGMELDFAGFCREWNQRYLVDVYTGKREFAEAFRELLVDVGFSTGQIHEVEGASAARRRELTESLRPLPNVAKTLSRLAGAGITMGILTDSELRAGALQERFMRLRIASRFRFFISSADIGHTMPHPVGYESALDALDMPARDVAFVGCATDDLAGAAAVGMRTIAINREDGARADRSLSRFEETLELCLPESERALAGY